MGETEVIFVNQSKIKVNMKHYRQKTRSLLFQYNQVVLSSGQVSGQNFTGWNPGHWEFDELKCCLKLKHFNQVGMKHRWSSGRILACHAGDPGSIPGRCSCCFFLSFFLFWSSMTSSTLISHCFNFDFCTYVLIVQPVRCPKQYRYKVSTTTKLQEKSLLIVVCFIRGGPLFPGSNP